MNLTQKISSLPKRLRSEAILSPLVSYQGYIEKYGVTPKTACSSINSLTKGVLRDTVKVDNIEELFKIIGKLNETISTKSSSKVTGPETGIITVSSCSYLEASKLLEIGVTCDYMCSAIGEPLPYFMEAFGYASVPRKRMGDGAARCEFYVTKPKKVLK